MTSIRDFNPADGQAFQGDVSIIPVPPGITIARADEVAPMHGKLILQEGELTGHHHGIDLLERPTTVKRSPAVDKLIADAQAGRIPVPTARMFRDSSAAEAMVRAGVLTRSDLVVGFIVVEHGPMVVGHPEHDGIRLPEGSYCVGRQVESAGAEERVVRD